MSIRPVEFNGIIQNSHEISQTRTAEEHKPVLHQANISVEVDKNRDQKMRSVNDPNKSEQQEYRYDRQGNGSGYQGNQGKKKKDEGKPKEELRSGVILKGTSSFDMKI
ncbi:MAG: hypothetical protein HUJ75_08805 [Parasporobacterium sp.]|nr:hypothetical protein [Parasporobacterium sp.]